MQPSQVVQEIRDAFSCAHLPHDQRVSIDAYDDEGAEATFTGRNWKDIDATELANVTACLHFLTPAAVRAYLPAFLVAALAEPCSGVAYSTVEFVKPPKGKPSRPSYFAWWSLLAPRQRLAIVSFLRAMPESVPGEHAEAADALEASANGS
jgi:hypothetical protein